MSRHDSLIIKDTHRGLLYEDGVFRDVLPAGRYQIPRSPGRLAAFFGVKAPKVEVVLVDVREDREFEADHLPGAVHLGKGIIERDVEVKYPDPETELVLYCGGGFRSALAADNLQKMGYTNVISMDGGIRDWREKGYPLEKSR